MHLIQMPYGVYHLAIMARYVNESVHVSALGQCV